MHGPIINLNAINKLLGNSAWVGTYNINENFNQELMWVGRKKTPTQNNSYINNPGGIILHGVFLVITCLPHKLSIATVSKPYYFVFIP